jgi:PAT family beta-lactamase induction signal transducer AmpG
LSAAPAAPSGRRLTLAEAPRLRLGVLCALYLAQGVPWGFVAITLAAVLAERGLGTERVGAMMALATLPWAFKWAWGPVVDAFDLPGGRRRPWVLLAQGMMALSLAALLLQPDPAADLAVLGWLLLVHNAFAALQDVAVDAMAVDLLTEDERGRANGLMYGSKYLGGAIGGAGLASVLAVGGLRLAIAAQLALLALIWLLPWRFRESAAVSAEGGGGAAPALALPAVVAGPLVRGVAVLRRLVRAFSLRSTLLGAALALAISLAMGVLSPVAAVLYTGRLGWTAQDYATVQGGLGVAFGLAGAVLGGVAADRVGHRRMVAFASAALGVLWIAFALLEPHWQQRWLSTALLLAEPLFGALMTVGLFALFMDLTWPAVAATQFTASMALLNLSTTIGHKIAGGLDALLSDAGLYAACGAFQIALLALLLGIDPGQTRRELGPAPRAPAPHGEGAAGSAGGSPPSTRSR